MIISTSSTFIIHPQHSGEHLKCDGRIDAIARNWIIQFWIRFHFTEMTNWSVTAESLPVINSIIKPSIMFSIINAAGVGGLTDLWSEENFERFWMWKSAENSLAARSFNCRLLISRSPLEIICFVSVYSHHSHPFKRWWRILAFFSTIFWMAFGRFLIGRKQTWN